MPIPHILSFSGGVVKEGAADTQRTDEMQVCDAYDIGPRGALIAARSVADYVDLQNEGSPVGPWEAVYKLASVAGNNFTKEIAVGIGNDAGNVDRVLLASFLRSGALSPVQGTDIEQFAAPAGGAQPTSVAQGYIVTVANFPGVYPVKNPVASVNVTLVNVGSRDGFAANLAPGLYVVMATPPSAVLAQPAAINRFDALGTGERGEFSGGSNAKQLRFRGIAAYGPHAMAWGHDESATDKEGAARLMFSNLNNPLKWGNDNIAAVAGNRLFTDSDAIIIGDGGEIIRGGITWDKRFWIGTDKQLHYVAGNGRDSFISDGSNPIAKAENILSPHTLIEGPDRLLYGCGDHGLWAFDGSTFERHHRRLRDFAGQSKDWWELIWTDRSRSDTYPGKTNADLVWMQPDYDDEQVAIGIPFCDATAGRGYGLDTVIIKFSTRTGGFTRQVFAGVAYTASDFPRRQRQYPTARFFGTATTGQIAVKKYGDVLASVGTLPSPLPKVQAGPYSHFGPNGVGVYRKAFLTFSWEPGAAAGAANLGDWTLQLSAVDDRWWESVCWSPELALFVAVANGDGVTNRVMTSPDGITWTNRAIASQEWASVCWSPTANGTGLFVAVSPDGGTQHCATSPDGTTWTLRTTPNRNWRGVCWSVALAKFVAVGSTGTADRAMTSTDGLTWTLESTTGATDNTWWKVTYAPELALFVAVGTDATGLDVMTSPTGVTWTHRTTPMRPFIHVCWSPELMLLVAICITGTNDQVATSPDGITWTTRTTPGGVNEQWGAVVWVPDASKFVAVNYSAAGTERSMTSPDGIVWTLKNTPATNQWRSVAYSPTLKRLVAVGVVSVRGRAMTADVADGTPAVPTIPDMRFKITPYVDEQALTSFKLSVRSTAPAAATDGDMWVDVSGSDTSIGNATAGVLVPAAADYIVKRYYRATWQSASVGGQKGVRATIPLTFTPARGTRLSLLIESEASNRRWQLEGLGFASSPVASQL